MEFKVIATGKNTRIAKDICDHLKNDRNYIAIQCPPVRNELFKMITSEMPQVVIICMNDDSYNAVKVYDIIRDCTRYSTISVIVVASKEDRKIFMANTILREVTFLSRPISLSLLYRKLDEIEKDWDETQKKQMEPELIEFKNTEPPEEFTRKHILVLDDDPEQLLWIKEHLREFYETTLIASGKMIFKCLEKFKVDLILLDYMMPEMDGPEVLKLLHAHPDYKKIPVVFLTGMIERETVINTIRELKPQGYLIKEL